MNLTQKIIKEHLVSGEMIAGKPIQIRIDQTLTQDATGTMAYLQLEAMKIDKVKTEISVSYVDHNTLQTGFENMDDHKYLQSVADKYGVIYSKCGNGNCHQVHLERFAKPGKTLLGSDSHTPTSSAMGSLAIGAGGLDVACAMAGRPFALNMPKVVKVELTGRMRHGVTAKDIILKLLSILTVKGGVGKVMEYCGEGIKTLSVTERATITNMGAELGATSSIFPSDENTLKFLIRQKRPEDYRPLSADFDATYDEEVHIDLNELEPMVACPHSPDNVMTISELQGLKIDQVAIGSCTNSSFTDLKAVANILKGKHINKDVSLVISFGSRQVMQMLSEDGALSDMINAGARILECTCGPCIGMGQAPNTNGVSLRTFNRNFKGRSGTESGNVYLLSPVAAAVSALNGVLSNPMDYPYAETDLPISFKIDDSMLIGPTFKDDVIYGPNIKPIPLNKPLENVLDMNVMIKVEDNITTDHIMPAGSKVLPYRSNIEKISEFCFSKVDPQFPIRCKENHGGIIIAGENYGQGSSREHAALAPLYLGIRFVIAKSYARIHRQNLINSGIIPFEFVDLKDYDLIDLNDEIFINKLLTIKDEFVLEAINRTKNINFKVKHCLNEYELELIYNGGLLNTIQKENGN